MHEARCEGYVDHRPNDLPPRSISPHGFILECDDGDHPRYIAPVEVQLVCEVDDALIADFRIIMDREPENDDEILRIHDMTHAVIGILPEEGKIITVYENDYWLFDALTGMLDTAPLDCYRQCRITPETLDRLRRIVSEREKVRIP